jgi:hypothetical protein
MISFKLRLSILSMVLTEAYNITHICCLELKNVEV